MAVSRYGKGDLCGVSVRGEEEGDADKPFIHAGVMTSLKIDPGLTYEEQPVCGSRLKGTEFLTGMDITAEVEFKVGKGADWFEWFKWLMGTSSAGAVTGLQNTPKSRSVAFKVANSSVDLLTNAYVDELQIRSEKIGAPLVFNAKIIAGGYEIGSDVSGAPISDDTPLRCKEPVQWSLSSSKGPLPAGAWTLTITQNLEKVAGANEDGITVASGGEPYLGAPTVVFELTVPARSRTFDQLKMSQPIMGGIRFFITLMGRVLTIEGGIIDSDATQRNQGTYDETIRVRATNVTLS